MTELILDNYKVQATGADGGHKYILTEIDYKGIKRKLVIMFLDKSEESNLNENEAIKVIGKIEDEGIEYDLTMRKAKVEKK